VQPATTWDWYCSDCRTRYQGQGGTINEVGPLRTRTVDPQPAATAVCPPANRHPPSPQEKNSVPQGLVRRNPRLMPGVQERHARRDSNPQPSDPKFPDGRDAQGCSVRRVVFMWDFAA